MQLRSVLKSRLTSKFQIEMEAVLPLNIEDLSFFSICFSIGTSKYQFFTNFRQNGPISLMFSHIFNSKRNAPPIRIYYGQKF